MHECRWRDVAVRPFAVSTTEEIEHSFSAAFFNRLLKKARAQTGATEKVLPGPQITKLKKLIMLTRLIALGIANRKWLSSLGGILFSTTTHIDLKKREL